MRNYVLFALLVISILVCGNAVAKNVKPTSKEVIITTKNLIPYAKQLAKIHESNGIQSKIVTVEEIWKNYTPVSPPPIRGYVNDSRPYVSKYLKAYNYTLAMKIISYLRTQIGKVEYVTLLGDVKAIPPSYYIDLKETMIPLTPTDFFYASPSYSMKPVFAVGRIPASDANEAKTYVTKLENYYDHFNITQFRRALIYGGHICMYAGGYYGGAALIDYFDAWLGEAEVVDLMNNFNVTSKFNTSIYLGSDGYTFSYMRKQFNKVFSGGYGLVFHYSHGGVFSIQISPGTAYSIANLQKLHKIKGYVMPIFISGGCKVAAYDSKLLKIIVPPYDWSKKESFEGFLVLHNPGAIVAIGSTRETIGQNNFNVTNGFVNITSSDFINAIESKIVGDIGNVSTIGYAFKDALTHYAEKYGLKPKTPMNRRERLAYQVYFEIELLGDPTLNLPRLTEKKVHYPKYIFLAKSKKYVKILDDITNKYWTYPYYTGNLTIEAKEPLKLKFFYISSDTVPMVNKTVLKSGEIYRFAPKKEGLYLLRISNDKKEVWYAFYLKPEKRINHPPIIEKIKDISTTIGSNISVKINATDPDGDSIICYPISIPNGSKLVNFVFTWTPEEAGNFTVKFKVVDSKGAESFGSFKIFVKDNKIQKIALYPIHPLNGSKNEPLNETLLVKVVGVKNKGYKLQIQIYSSTGKLIGTNGSVWLNLLPGKVYKWYAIIRYGNKTIKSKLWYFETTHKPIAKFSYKVSGNIVTLAFTGDDPDHDKVTCIWNFGDGSVDKGYIVTHRYNKGGNYTITLTVIDSKGAKSNTSVRVSIHTPVIRKKKERTLPFPPFSKDLDGDGLYEDVNGDGKCNINDFVYLLLHYKNPLFQKHKQYYDFCPDGKLNCKDALFLYVYIHWHIKKWKPRH